MSWIKEANKYGTYEGTYRGYRMYCVQPATIQTTETETHRLTEFKSGIFVAINSQGTKLTKGGINTLWEAIDLQIINDWCNYKCTPSGKPYKQ